MKDALPPEPRLPLIEEPKDAVASALFAAIRAGTGRILNLHKMMAHAPALMQASYDTALAMRNGLQLRTELLELVILRTAQLCQSDYVWWRHLPLALATGSTQAKLDALSDWRTSPLFSEAEGAALAFAEAVVGGRESSAEDFAELQRHFTPREIVEMALAASHYLATARFIQALAIPAEAPR